jgi:peptidoglycan-N-acetylglucosamine deacetylase
VAAVVAHQVCSRPGRIVRTSPWSAKASGVVLGRLFTNYPDAIAGIVYDLHLQGLLFCRNRDPVGRYMPFPLACT